MDSHPPLVRTRLSAMMFLEFFVWGCWGVAIAGYGQTLGFTGSQIGWLAAVAAVGAIISPLFVGLIADRYFAAQRMLSVLHLMGGVCLIAAGFQDRFLPLMVAMLLNGLAFMPTMALVNSVAFRHIPDADKFPRIAVLGTFGWIAANLTAAVFLGGAATPNFLFLGGAGSLVLALYALTLPNTPPKGAAAGGDVFGLSALKLFKEKTFLVFIVCVFLLSIPACGYYFALMVPMFQQRGYPAPLALGTLNQFAEIVFMFSMPWFVSKLGLKRVLLIGMTAWAVRYLCFSVSSPMLSFPFAVLGLVLHGFCYSFFYVGAYMWVDRRAPAELKSSAQSLLAFLLLGVGFLAGAKGAGFMMERFDAKVPVAWQGTVVEITQKEEPDPGEAKRAIVELAQGEQEAKTIVDVENADVEAKEVKTPLPPWNAPKSVLRYLDLSGTVNRLRTGKEPERSLDIADELDSDGDRQITMAEVKAIDDDGLEFGGNAFSRDEMIILFKRVAEAQQEGPVAEDKISLNRDQWLAAQSCNWVPIWLWPSAAAFIILAVFALAFRDDSRQEEGRPEGSEDPEESAPDESP